MSDLDDIFVPDAAAPAIVSVKLAEDGIIVEFADGDKAMFCTQTLHEMLMMSRHSEDPHASGMVQ